jgi:hypothetical protein
LHCSQSSLPCQKLTKKMYMWATCPCVVINGAFSLNCPHWCTDKGLDWMVCPVGARNCEPRPSSRLAPVPPSCRTGDHRFRVHHWSLLSYALALAGVVSHLSRPGCRVRSFAKAECEDLHSESGTTARRRCFWMIVARSWFLETMIYCV